MPSLDRLGRVALVLTAGTLVVLAFETLFFWVGFYIPLLSPNSTAGSFERTLSRVRATVATAPSGNGIVVLGDSRISSGFSAEVANRFGAGLTFINAATPGTTPRCWRFFVRALDLDNRHVRALVVPVDTLGDDDSALGSLDAWDHIEDLRYVIFHVGLMDIPWFARSIHYAPNRRQALEWMLLRGRLESADLQAFLVDPAQRVRELTHSGESFPGANGRTESLAGLRADFAHDSLAFPPSVPPPERAAIAHNVLTRANQNAQYAQYRREILGDLIGRMRTAHIPVIIVRIPTRPLARPGTAESLGASLREFSAGGGVRVVRAAAYEALERPEFFADEHHLNIEGRKHFSALLARDVAAAVGAP